MDKGKAMYAATQTSSYQLPVEPAPRTLLIVEDDKAFLERLSRAMETRGFTVTSCDNVPEGLTAIEQSPPAFAVGLGMLIALTSSHGFSPVFEYDDTTASGM